MYQAIPEPRKELCEYAPRITAIRIDKEKIREIIGPGGKIVRDIQETTGTTIVIEDDGTVQVAAANKSQRDAALKRIRDIVAEPELGADLRRESQVHRGFRRVRGVPARQGRARAHFRARPQARQPHRRRGQDGRRDPRQTHRFRPFRQGQAEQKSPDDAAVKLGKRLL